MPVPEIEIPTVQPEARPAAQAPAPSLGAFPGAHVGAGLEKVSGDLFSVGWDSYTRAARAHAQEKETEFLKGALKIRDQYKNLYNLDAVRAHEGASADIEELRKKIGGTLRSEHGLEIYNNNSLRRQGFVQESIDSHFEQQNKAYQITQYKQGQEQDVRLVASLATDAKYNPEAVEGVIRGMHGRALEFGASRGMDAETAGKFAPNETHVATDALFRALLDPKAKRDPALVRSELEKYVKLGMVDAARQKDAQHALGGSEANAWIASTMANFVRVDHLGNSDPEGYVPYREVVKAAGTVAKDDPNREQKIDGLIREWSRHDAAFQRAGAEMENDVVARDVVGDQSSMEWQKFARLYPMRADGPSGLSAKVENRAYQSSRREQATQRDASREAYGSVRYYLDQLSTEDVKEVTAATVDQLMRSNYHGPGTDPDPIEKAKALEMLKKLQTGKLDPIERKFNSIASQALEEAYKGNKAKVRAALNRAHYILDDAYSASVRGGKPMSENDLRQKLVDEFSKKGGLLGTSFLGSRSGENYQRAPRGPVRIQTDADFEALKSGTEFIGSDGVLRRKP